jgi:5'-nucleotidase / UDP-sugar diphosphatase
MTSASAAPTLLPATDGASASNGGGDLLTLARVPLKETLDAPRVIGTCDPAKGMRFQLAHFNDLQARYSDTMGGGVSRYAYIAGYLKQLKAAQPTLVLDAGDDYEKGAVAELRSMGEATRQIVQAMPIDVRTIGNHDFAYGEVMVMRDVRLSKHPVLAANVKHLGLPANKQPFRSYARVDVGCVKVGVIGLVTQQFGADDQPTKDPYFGVLAVDDHYQAILEREAKAHRAEVDVLIALTHLGYADDIALAHKGGRYVDIIVGAHTEDLIKEPNFVVHPDNSKTYIVQAGHFGETLGRGDVVVTKEKDKEKLKVTLEKYKIIEVDEKLPKADDVAEIVKRVEEASTPDTHGVIGKTSAAIKQGKPLAELVYRAAVATWGIDALVIGKDLFWTGLPKGDLTLQRVYDAVLVQRQPSGTSGFSSIYVAELTGAELAPIAKNFRVGGTYEWFGPKDKFDPTKKYRLAIDKRGATYPKTLFGPIEGKTLLVGEPGSYKPRAVFMGEMIDALEPYIRARTQKGQPVE